MKACGLSIIVALLALVATTSCRTEIPTEVDGKFVPRPDVVKIFIGSAWGPCYEVFSDGVNVRYKKAEGMVELEQKSGVNFVPDLRQWKQFRADLDQINAWNWQASYVNTNIVDGESWYTIIVDQQDQVIDSWGSNAYPLDFDRFVAAVRRLIGNREFESFRVDAVIRKQRNTNDGTSPAEPAN